MENNLQLDIFRKVFKVEKSKYSDILKDDLIFLIQLENYTHFGIFQKIC